jgi:hypothetical protein
MLKVYVAGAYRSATEDGVFNNIVIARETAARLWENGYAAFCPHLNTAFMGGLVPDETFLEGDRLFLAACDVLMLLPGWRNSAGANAERDFATIRNIPVVEDNFAGWNRLRQIAEDSAPSP